MKTAIAKKHLTELHSEITEWKNVVALMKDELTIFNHQLGEILSKNNKTEATAEGEHFQNQFIRHYEVVDELIHDLKLADHAIKEKVTGNASADHILQEDHVDLREKIITQEDMFANLKITYKQFLAKWF